MGARLILVGLVVLLPICQTFAQTCDQIKYTLINDLRRSTAYKTTTTRICDRGFIKDDEWYRFESVAGNTMPTKNPGISVCGTNVSIWLNGAHPTTDNVAVDRKACAALPSIPPAGCGISYNIKVIKCGAFYLYRLKEPKQCDLAYCAGDKLPDTKCSITGSTLPVCPDNRAPVFTTSKVFYAFKRKELRVELSARDPENCTFHYSFAQTETFGASLRKNGSFRWTKNTNDPTVFRFNVTDGYGAYCTVNITVVLRDCPCQNSGECLPDYRYLDGAGNFTCSCPAEYNGTLCELDVDDECAVSKPCFNGTCKNAKPGFSCSCFAGYTGDLCQTEIDECASNPCFLGVTCTDVINGFTCGPCPRYEYTGNGVNCSRLDGQIDECVRNPQICHRNGACVYREYYNGWHNGNFVCQCRQGYNGDGKNNCIDIDECQDSPCDQNAQCENTNGSFSCHCNKGFTRDGIHNCTDINECLQSPTVCPVNAECRNTLGSYWCQYGHCRRGFISHAQIGCTDIDECKLKGNSSVCHSLADCSNTAGSFSCQCKKGYTGNGKTNCADIDECQYFAPCNPHAGCTNTIGSFYCKCVGDLVGDGVRNCAANQRPRFTIPVTVYAVLNKDFHMQITAVDPEGQNVTFALSPDNPTGVAITPQGQLTIRNYKDDNRFNTVDIQVVDEMGASNRFVLEVRGFECRCQHKGECYRKKSSRYPVKRSDYLCSVGSEIKLTNQEWSEQLTKKTSKEYKNMASQLIAEIRKLYEDFAEFSNVIIKGFRRGSVVVEFQLIFTKKVENPLEPLSKAAKTGKLGNMPFEIRHLDGKPGYKEEATGDDKIIGLDKTVFIIIIVAIVVALILIVVTAVWLWRRQRSHKNVELNNRTIGNPDRASTMQQDGDSGEDIDLKAFNNDTVCVDDEIKLQP